MRAHDAATMIEAGYFRSEDLYVFLLTNVIYDGTKRKLL